MRLLIGGITLLLLTGCVSTHMKKYVERDIRDVVLDSGPPIHAFDMPDGQRAFQFYWGGGTVAMPQVTTSTGQATVVGNSAWFSGTAITSGGGVVTSQGCLITYLTTWDAGRQGWIVKGYRYPDRVFC